MPDRIGGPESKIMERHVARYMQEIRDVAKAGLNRQRPLCRRPYVFAFRCSSSSLIFTISCSGVAKP